MANTLYYGDNLYYLRELPSESADLVYLDPPFNSKATYNLLFHSPEGEAVEAQTAAFRDTWWWDTPAERAFDDVIASGSGSANIIRAFRSFLGDSDIMAYLAMMAVRLIEIHRLLRQSGSVYLHCDPTSSHYLKIILDAIFGPDKFQNEIVWRRTTPKGLAFTRFPSNHDTLLFYRKSDRATWNAQYVPHRPEYVQQYYSLVEEGTGRRFQATSLLNPNPNRPNLTYEFHGHTKVWRWTKHKMLEAEKNGRIYFPPNDGVPREKRYLDEQEGTPVTSVWIDIPAVNSQARERLGYPTQKPVALLERVISASSNPGDVVLDPFCGCGTSIEAAERLGRSWMGIDITHHAIDIIDERMKREHPRATYKITGRPEDLDAAYDLARRDKYEFQWWANWLIGVQNYRERKKGGDRGIDGIIYFRNGPWGIGEIIVSVKGGEGLNPGMISALRGTVERENAQMGVFICLAEATQGMRREAAAAGFVTTAQGRFQRLQIATIEELLSGRRPSMPRPIETEAFRQPLRPVRRAKEEPIPEPQLSLPLAFAGGRAGRKTRDIEDHLSGLVLANIVRP